MSGMYDGRTVLVTGGTGSFGTMVVRHLLEGGCRKVRILSRDETKQHEMRLALGDPRAEWILGDVRDRASVDMAMRGIDWVFHAAALKQVPSCEFFPVEAVRTNVLGSENVIEAALAAGAERVVCLSTDKAVYPINAMGMTKALMEKIVAAKARLLENSRTVLCCVRYGNVMYSRGSVIPLFVRQIREGRAITVTEPAMTRFLMPLSDAVGLVEFALTHGRQGDLFIRKSPASTVIDLARAVLALFGGRGEIREIGRRHGEKMHETLATFEELAKAEDMGEHYRIPLDERSLNYDLYFTEGHPIERPPADYTSENTRRLSLPEVEALLLSLPEIQAALAAP